MQCSTSEFIGMLPSSPIESVTLYKQGLAPLPGVHGCSCCAEYTFLTYGPTALSSTVNNLASNTGGPQINHISCPVPVNGAQTACTVGNQHAVASSTSVANTKAFGFSTEVKIGVCLSLDLLRNFLVGH